MDNEKIKDYVTSWGSTIEKLESADEIIAYVEQLKGENDLLLEWLFDPCIGAVDMCPPAPYPCPRDGEIMDKKCTRKKECWKAWLKTEVRKRLEANHAPETDQA